MHFVCCFFDPTMEQFLWYKGDVGQHVKTMQVGKFRNIIEKVIQNLSKWPFSKKRSIMNFYEFVYLLFDTKKGLLSLVKKVTWGPIY